MKYIIISEVQADQIRGNYGNKRGIDNTFPASIEPLKIPDGNFIFSESCIGGYELESIEDELTAMVTPNNVQDIIDLPDVGGLCEKDHLYNYSDGTLEGYNGLVKCIQSHNRTIYPPIETPALFSFFRENSDDLEWIQNEWVELGWKRWYNGLQYVVIQAHQTLITWTPDVTPALWQPVEIPEVIPVWVQPTGAHDAYQIGDKVHFPTINDPVYESLINANVWSPTIYPAGWRQI